MNVTERILDNILIVLLCIGVFMSVVVSVDHSARIKKLERQLEATTTTVEK